MNFDGVLRLEKRKSSSLFGSCFESCFAVFAVIEAIEEEEFEGEEVYRVVFPFTSKKSNSLAELVCLP
jgi:hypothetical protein